MAVYIDDYSAAFRGMVMCHMIADTTEELLKMADKIGVQRKWIQKPGTRYEHFDVCRAKRALAIANGAIETDSRTLVGIMINKSQGDVMSEETKETVEKKVEGRKHIDTEWQSFSRLALDFGCGAGALRLLHRAFFAGATATWCKIMTEVRTNVNDFEADQRFLDEIHDELTAFAESLGARKV